jgi:uncharacterized Zn finger protein
MSTFKLTETIIRATANEKSFARGQELYRSGAISDAAIQGNTLTGLCEGAQSPFYKVRAELDGGGIRAASCSCDYNFDGYCKHIVALLLAYSHKPKQFAVRKDPADLIAKLDREQLAALLIKLMRESPELYDTVEAAMAAPSAAGKGKTRAAKRKKVDVEPYRRRVRSLMRSSGYDNYGYAGGLASELGVIEKTAMEFLDVGDAETALRILLTLLEESRDCFESVDDSDGDLGDYFGGLGETLAEVILSLDDDGRPRAELLRDLEKIDRNFSDYGVDGMEVAIAAAKYGWESKLPDSQAERPVAATDDEWDDDEHDDDDDGDEDDGEVFTTSGSLQFGRYGRESVVQALTRAKLNVLERQERTDEYLALCLQTGAHLRYAQKLVMLGRAPDAVKYAQKQFEAADDALKLAQQLREAGKLEEALGIGEHGLKLGGGKSALGAWLGPMEEVQGRTEQALEAWQAAFHSSPSLAVWQTIKRLAGTRWQQLKPELMASLEKHYSRQPLVEVLLEEQEWDGAMAVADKEKYDYRLVATVADALIVHRPEWVVRASIKQAEVLIEKTQSKYYPYAADWLRRAKGAYAEMGRSGEWRKYLTNLKEQYRRRPALMAQLDKL